MMPLRLTWALLASTLFAALFSASACSSAPIGPWQSTTGRAFAVPVPGVPGIDNFARITEGLARGGQPSNEGFKWLKDQGFRTVITFRQHHAEPGEAERLGLTVVEIPLQADVLGSEPPTDEQVRKFFETVLDPARRPIYFHCAHGKDRTGTMAAIYRIEVDGWTNDEAVEEMRFFGYHTIYQDLIAFVKSYKPRGFAPRK